MLAAPAVPLSAPTFEPSPAAFKFPSQQQQHNFYPSQHQYQPPHSANPAPMNGVGNYSHSRAVPSTSSSGSRGTNNNNYIAPNGGFRSNSTSGSNGQAPNGMSEAASSSTIVAPSNSRRNRRPDTEELKRVGRVHYQELFIFLKSLLARGQRGPRTNAREKLTRLSQQQFTELSTDVYDELMRRISNSRSGSEMPHLAVREEFHPKRNQARQKLATLPKNRFKDLSSDVFFELERRFPYLRDEYRPEASERERREQEETAMQQRSRTADGRQNSALSAGEEAGQEYDTTKQSERTVVERADDSNGARAGGAAASTSDVVIPAKSTLVEEEIAVPYANTSDESKDWRASGEGEGVSSNRDSLMTSTDADHNRNTMYSQASSVGTGFFNGYATSRATDSVASPHLGQGDGFGTSSTFGIEKMRSDYEFRIATLQQKVTALESKGVEQEKVKAEKVEEMERQLQDLEGSHSVRLGSLSKELDQHRTEHQSTQAKLTETLSKLDELHLEHEALRDSGKGRGEGGGGEDEQLQQELETLQREYAEQEEVVTELRGEVTSLVEELRQLSLRNDDILADKDSDQAVIRDLNNQVSSYKRKYENAKTELRNLKATSQLYVQPPKADDFMPASEEGAIADVNLTAFQSSIDELVTAARSKTPSNVLLAMKTVVLATTLVTDDVAKYEQREPNSEVKDQLVVIKGRVSNTLNNLMTACRNHASSHGLSPVSLLDAAASHVSTSIVDVVKLLKVRKATKVEAEEFEATFTQNGTLPNGLKPLHTNVLNSSQIASTPFSPGGGEFRRRGSEAAAKAEAQDGGNNNNRLGPLSNGTSPRTRQGPTMGRYSPVSYRPDLGRKNSSGAGSWKTNDGSRTRNASISSNTSSGNAVHKAPPAVPLIDEAILRSSSRSISGNSSAPRSPNTGGSNDRSSFDETNGKADSVLASLRASLAPPAPVMGATAAREDSREENWAELRNYIEVQTEAIVHSIQALLSSIREGAQGNQLNENLTQITTIVSSIIAISKDNIPKSKDGDAKSLAADLDGERILKELSENCEKLIEMQMIGKFDKLTKSNMASASYGVAKGLKALSGLLYAEER